MAGWAPWRELEHPTISPWASFKTELDQKGAGWGHPEFPGPENVSRSPDHPVFPRLGPFADSASARVQLGKRGWLGRRDPAAVHSCLP